MTLQENERRRRQSKRDREAEQDRRDQHLHDEARLQPVVAKRNTKREGDKPKRTNTKVEDEARLSRANLSNADQRVLDYRQWCALAGISFMTAKRLIKAGEGPRTVQISKRRIGIRMIDHTRWLEARLRSA